MNLEKHNEKPKRSQKSDTIDLEKMRVRDLILHYLRNERNEHTDYIDEIIEYVESSQPGGDSWKQKHQDATSYPTPPSAMASRHFAHARIQVADVLEQVEAVWLVRRSSKRGVEP